MQNPSGVINRFDALSLSRLSSPDPSDASLSLPFFSRSRKDTTFLIKKKERKKKEKNINRSPVAQFARPPGSGRNDALWIPRQIYREARPPAFVAYLPF